MEVRLEFQLQISSYDTDLWIRNVIIYKTKSRALVLTTIRIRFYRNVCVCVCVCGCARFNKLMSNIIPETFRSIRLRGKISYSFYIFLHSTCVVSGI